MAAQFHRVRSVLGQRPWFLNVKAALLSRSSLIMLNIFLITDIASSKIMCLLSLQILPIPDSTDSMVSVWHTTGYIWKAWVRTRKKQWCHILWKTLEVRTQYLWSTVLKGLRFYHRQANMLTCQRFLDSDRRCTIPGSDTEGFITHVAADSRSFMFIFILFVPPTPKSYGGHG